MCAECGARPAGHGHFALYCQPCSLLPYGIAAPLDEDQYLIQTAREEA